jgi:hypothetical protein
MVRRIAVLHYDDDLSWTESAQCGLQYAETKSVMRITQGSIAIGYSGNI